MEGMRGSASDEYEGSDERLKQAKAESAACTARKVAKEQELQEAKSDLQQCYDSLKKTEEKMKKQSRGVEEARKRLGNLLEKKNRLMSEMDHAQAQQRDLGSLPETFEKYVEL
jgi:chromosome segregation ATPase